MLYCCFMHRRRSSARNPIHNFGTSIQAGAGTVEMTFWCFANKIYAWIIRQKCVGYQIIDTIEWQTKKTCMSAPSFILSYFFLSVESMPMPNLWPICRRVSVDNDVRPTKALRRTDPKNNINHLLMFVEKLLIHSLWATLFCVRSGCPSIRLPSRCEIYGPSTHRPPEICIEKEDTGSETKMKALARGDIQLTCVREGSLQLTWSPTVHPSAHMLSLMLGFIYLKYP